MAQRHLLTRLPAALIEAGYEPVAYRRAYEAARSALIPACPDRGGRWTFAADDLPAIAEALGLMDAHAA